MTTEAERLTRQLTRASTVVWVVVLLAVAGGWAAGRVPALPLVAVAVVALLHVLTLLAQRRRGRPAAPPAADGAATATVTLGAGTRELLLATAADRGQSPDQVVLDALAALRAAGPGGQSVRG